MAESKVQKNPPRQSEIAERLFGQIARAANSLDVIRWEELTGRVAEAPAPLTEQARVRLLVRLINKGVLTGREFNQLAGIGLMREADERQVRLPDSDLDGLARTLAALLDPTQAEKAQSYLRELTRGRVLLMPEGEDHRIIAADLRTALAFALLAAGRDPRLMLCRQCGEFFFKKEGHGRPRKFCSDKCSRDYDNSIAADRMRQRRQEVKEKRRRK